MEIKEGDGLGFVVDLAVGSEVGLGVGAAMSDFSVGDRVSLMTKVGAGVSALLLEGDIVSGVMPTVGEAVCGSTNVGSRVSW